MKVYPTPGSLSIECATGGCGRCTCTPTLCQCWCHCAEPKPELPEAFNRYLVAVGEAVDICLGRGTR